MESSFASGNRVILVRTVFEESINLAEFLLFVYSDIEANSPLGTSLINEEILSSPVGISANNAILDCLRHIARSDGEKACGIWKFLIAAVLTENHVHSATQMQLFSRSSSSR
jgi:hypothetical protein